MATTCNNKMRPALFWDGMQRRKVVTCWSFKTTYDIWYIC